MASYGAPPPPMSSTMTGTPIWSALATIGPSASGLKGLMMSTSTPWSSSAWAPVTISFSSLFSSWSLNSQPRGSTASRVPSSIFWKYSYCMS